MVGWSAAAVGLEVADVSLGKGGQKSEVDTVLTLFQCEQSAGQASTAHTAHTVHDQACGGTDTAAAHEPINPTANS